ncbi:MAG: GSCFA domain-containing protein [Lentisphaeria bacterium]
MLANPNALELLENALFCKDTLWHSFFFHSSFSASHRDLAWQKMQTSWQQGRKALLEADFLLLTWGSALAWYHHSAAKQAVANCHCLPEQEFERRLIAADEIANTYRCFLSHYLKEHASLRIILSVSPVRHCVGDLPLNSVSKAQLLIAAKELCQAFPKQVFYFPAYEILLDELRDYRFYAEDFCHPSPLAEKLVRERFLSSWGTPELQKYMALTAEQKQLEQHRPRLPESPQVKLWQQHAEQRQRELNTALQQLRQPLQDSPPEVAPAAAGRQR